MSNIVDLASKREEKIIKDIRAVLLSFIRQESHEMIRNARTHEAIELAKFLHDNDPIVQLRRQLDQQGSTEV